VSWPLFICLARRGGVDDETKNGPEYGSGLLCFQSLGILAFSSFSTSTFRNRCPSSRILISHASWASRSAGGSTFSGSTSLKFELPILLAQAHFVDGLLSLCAVHVVRPQSGSDNSIISSSEGIIRRNYRIWSRSQQETVAI
jgi:hypothetical protein